MINKQILFEKNSSLSNWNILKKAQELHKHPNPQKESFIH